MKLKMLDTDDIRYNKPTDRLLEAINQENLRLHGIEPNAHNAYQIACKVLRRRLNIDTFTVEETND